MYSPFQRWCQNALFRVRPALLAAALKKLLRIRRTVIETASGRFFVDPVTLLGRQLIAAGSFEPYMQTTLEHYLGPGGIFVDLGANEGWFTVLGARLCGPAGRVISIEPQQRLLPVIEENLRLNDLDNLGNVVIVNAAITDAAGIAHLHLTADTNSGASGLFRPTRYALPTQTVATLTLEQMLDEHELPVVDLMKMDIEGFEYEALLGSRRVFEQQRIRALALELHPSILAKRGKDVRDITTMMESCGYTSATSSTNLVWTVSSGGRA